MRVFIAGGTGAVGRRLVPLLVRGGHVVAGVSRTDEGVRRLRSYGSEGRVVDIADRSAVIEAVADFRPDVIAHQVTDLRHLDLDANATIRRLGTRNLVDAAHTAGVRRIVAQSISWAYEPGEMPAVESDPLDLAAAEPRLTTVRGIADSEAFVAEVPEFVTLRYGMFYGPDTFFAAGSRMAREAHAGRLVGDDSITNFIHVDDAADAAFAAMEWAPGVVNIGDDDPASACDWMPVFAHAVGAAAPSSRDGRAGWARGVDNTHARQDLGWMPRVLRGDPASASPPETRLAKPTGASALAGRNRRHERRPHQHEAEAQRPPAHTSARRHVPVQMEDMMRLTNRRTASDRSSVRLTKAAGWILITFGAVHVVVAPLDTRDVWSQVVSDGWWNTFTLDKSTTLAQFERSETFWVTAGSFGVPLLVLGCYVVWSMRQHHRVPGWIGWSLLGYGLLIVTTLPASPAWALAVSGALIVLGDRRRRRATSPRSGHGSWSQMDAA